MLIFEWIYGWFTTEVVDPGDVTPLLFYEWADDSRFVEYEDDDCYFEWADDNFYEWTDRR